MKTKPILAVALLLSSCVSSEFRAPAAKLTSADELGKICRIDTADHIAYMGSDETFHYFFHSKLFASESFKVAKTNINWIETFPLGSGKPRLVSFPKSEKDPDRR